MRKLLQMLVLVHEIGWTGSQKQGGNVAANGVRGWSRANGIVCLE